MNSSNWEKNFQSAMSNYKKQYTGTIQEELSLNLVSSNEEEKSAIFVFQPTNRCKNQWNVVHGGILSVLFDAAMGLTAKVSSEKITTPTVTMQMTYMSPHRIEEPIYIEAKTLSIGGRLIYMFAESHQLNANIICASASATYYLRSEPLVKL